MTIHMNTLSFALLALAAVAYARQAPKCLWAAGLLFFPLTGLTTVLAWWPLAPLAAILILVLTLGVPLVCLALFAMDVLWAPFCLEMTYLTFLCWLLCPLSVVLNYMGTALQAA